jgi:hypothetical protein
MDLITYALLKR